MQLIVITSPEQVAQEQQICCKLFELGLETLHLRKPQASIIAMRQWLQQVPENYHCRVMLHSQHELGQEFAVKGLHFPEASRAKAADLPKYNLRYSTSFHQLHDVLQPQPYFDYGFLSPVFQSISKKKYPAGFTAEELKQVVPKATLPLVALGGVTAAKLPQLQQLGFAGAAVLGVIWESTDPVKAFQELIIPDDLKFLP